MLRVNYGLQVVCAAITYFYVAFVEDLVPVIFRKMFTDEVQELSADVCLYVHAVGRIKPNYVSLSVLAAVPCGVSCKRSELISKCRHENKFYLANFTSRQQ